MSFCTKCGAEMSDDTRFCTKCGQSVSGADNPYASNLTTDNVAYAPGVGSAGPMTFGKAVSTCFNKYADFNGRARRAEYWYFILFQFLVNFVLAVIQRFIGENAGLTGVKALVGLVFFLPQIAVTARRLHDCGITGWFQLAPQLFFLLALVSIFIGIRVDAVATFFGYVLLVLLVMGLGAGILLLIRLVRKGDAGENKYGPDPLEA